jgi:transcriptional regulator with XRE-family HTH domain
MDSVQLRQLRKAARLTQLELSQRTGIERTRVSFAECDYVRLSNQEEVAVRRAVAESVESRSEQVRRALDGSTTLVGVRA